ncbi:DUF2254 domain-containing protein [Citrobacter amalonaticus]|uniref:DUF2254 domain-containing protein n=1 Tax=Citrobacter amalonaticus TaxID=35703 RepID=A0A8I0MMG0_CITAM|nr:DUF2254 domain-containing protein [Citrobacter amalonaticus]MBE0129486.1 DUF2254 domain-containing protein [Citrobacter amalonaticus]
MLSKWQWVLKQVVQKLWFRATLFAIAAIATALISILFKSFIPVSVSVKIGAEAVDNILNILASSMLAVTTFSLNIMVGAYSSATTNVSPRATRLVIADSTTQNVLATFIGSFLFSLVGIIALNMGAYGERGRVILFVVTLVVIALILITLLRWIQHLTSLGRVGETTARVEQAATDTFVQRAQTPSLGGFPWTESHIQPQGTWPLFTDRIGYVEHIDMGRLASFIKDSTLQLFLCAQPGSYTHPSRAIMYTTEQVTAEFADKLQSALTISDVRSFTQDPRFCLSVLAEIACRALSPAVNDPGTAIDVTSRVVRVLSEYARHYSSSAKVLYPDIHVAPLQINHLMEDYFAPVSRDGAGSPEVLIRNLKSLAMLHDGWPKLFTEATRLQAMGIIERLEATDFTETEKRHITETFNTHFG